MARCVQSGQVFRWSQVSEDRWAGVDGDFWYRVSVLPDSLEVETNGSQADFESLFRLDWDAVEIERQLLERGPELEPYLSAHRGLRLMRPSSASETLVSFLCSPNNHLSRIGAMVGKLAAYGEPIGDGFFRFPKLEVVAGISEARLREMGFGYRGATLNRAAGEVAARGGDRYLEELKARPLAEVRKELVALPGVGKKLADCIALFALHRTEVAPIDTHLWHSATRLYFPGYAETALTDRRYEEISLFFENRFGKWAGWAQQALFLDRVLNWRKP